MIKLLIVDDEQIEREGLQAILQKAFPTLAIEQAKNGRIAVEMAQKFLPDLILVDIKMPGMNGFDVVEQVKATNANSKFVMVTAYAKFDYAKLAMKHGVIDYILKPSKASEIVETVGKVLQSIEEEHKSLETNLDQQEKLEKAMSVVETDVVTQLLFDHVHELQLDELVRLLDVRSTNEVFVMSLVVPIGSENCYPAVKNKVRESGSGWVGALYGRQLPIIMFRKPDTTFRSQAIFLAREILSVVNDDVSKGCFIGIGNVYSTLNDIRKSYQESLIATKDTMLPVKYRFYSDLPAIDPQSDEQLMKEREKDFFDQIHSGQWELVYANLMDLIKRYESADVNINQAQQHALEFLWIASRVLGEMGIESDTPIYPYQIMNYRQLRAETSHLLEKLKQSSAAYYDQLEDDIIHQIKQYIIDNSNQDISLDMIAKKVGLSPIYISKMFKEQLGINYINFLTECRIDKAKKLMMDPDRSLKEITFEVGYHDPNYFSKVFKRMCGESPTKYRKNLLTNKGIISFKT
ncbi:response regulator [Radiobacillus sp. PE A8.2]|uniref:response regulator n=1 Tax=Radiobacillus sp. PE A8.2 TaxID=3380349 RepID=UPI00388D9854